MTRIIVGLSGGMDSATLLALAIERSGRENVLAVSFRYPSKHNVIERQCAAQVAGAMSARLFSADVSGSFEAAKSDLLTSGGQIPEGHYEAESMRRTVVPGRNLIFLSVLASLAESHGYDEVWLGAHSGDHHIYPDCRPDFVHAACYAVHCSTAGRVKVAAPFLHDDKASILKRGFALKVPYQLTRTCYTEGEVACGKCGSCCERREAFAKNGVEDPIPYAYSGPLPESPTRPAS